MNVWVWLGPLIAIILIIIGVIIVIVVHRWRKHPRVTSGRMSRFTESFRRRIGKEGISNPVFVLDNVRIQNARTLPRTSENTASATEEYRFNNNVHSDHANRDSSVYDLAKDIKTDLKISTLESVENVYVEHDLPSRELQPAHVAEPPYKPVPSFLYSSNDRKDSHAFSKTCKIKPFLKENSVDQTYETVSKPSPLYDTPRSEVPDTNYDTPRSRVPDSNYDIPRLHVPDTNYDIPKSPSPSLRPSFKLGQLPPTPEPAKKAIGNVELEPSEAQRVSTGSQSEDSRTTSGEYLNVDGAQLRRSRPHRAIAEPEDAYDFAPRAPTGAEDIYVEHSPGATLPPGQSPGVAMSGHGDATGTSNSDDSNIYDSIEEEISPNEEPVIGTDIENPLFGVPEVTDLYENHGTPDERWGSVTLGSDHVYDTIA